MIRFGISAGLSLLAASMLAACVPLRGGWETASLERQHPELLRHSGSRLGDLLPHFIPKSGGIALFLCRWSKHVPIPVSLPGDASESERRSIVRALSAWSGAGLGLQLIAIEGERGAIEIRFARANDNRWVPAGTGDTLTDCAVDEATRTLADFTKVTAHISFVSIYLRGANTDALGRELPLSEDELTGAVIHELGHALGFASHVAVGPSVMSVSPEVVRQVGRRVNRGEAFSDPTLSALYALDSGVVVGELALSRSQSVVLNRVVEEARRSGFWGPYTRVGDQSARIFWLGSDGEPVVLSVPHWREALNSRKEVVFELNDQADRILHSTVRSSNNKHWPEKWSGDQRNSLRLAREEHLH